ncbi:EcsC family protein [Metabacillus arenae]|uniref:EcsC family protein n=1 Tax=Metabacillus arenae TaxID=2771434 RepID=A0A926RY07_9BACI|nr:EcsC family protein [Metabacillus arenae]MBD1380702.1 EcsC family protein [Metabacillus arenae]
MSYERKVEFEVQQWKTKLLRKSSVFERVSKRVQNKINEKIPEKIHVVVTESIKKMVEATLHGSNLTTFKKDTSNLSLEEKDKLVFETLKKYQKAAAIEGAGTGAGGFALSLADFPLLLGIKMKFLFEAASIYGFNTKKIEERVFLLHLFQLAFSSEEKRPLLLEKIEAWDQMNENNIDWRVFQQDYRDFIDLVKLFQLLPGIGAVVGGVANYKLLDHLGEYAMNGFRLRIIKDGNE